MTRKKDTMHLAHAAPRPAGAYWVGGVDEGVAFTLRARPRWWHRLMMRWACGWVWVDEKQ